MKLTAITAFASLSAITSARVFGPTRNFISRQVTNNLQTFKGNVGAAAPSIKRSDNEDGSYEVNGASFHNLEDAAMRSCDAQFNSCVNEANLGAEDFDFADCTVQKEECLASHEGMKEDGCERGEEDGESSDSSDSSEDESDSDDEGRGVHNGASNHTMAATNGTAPVNSTGIAARRSLKARGYGRKHNLTSCDDGKATTGKLKPLRARINRAVEVSDADAAQEKRRGRLIRRTM